ncbi:membrane protease YdiL (CAAX protease family) [Rhizomicrobium palustre]|uniref:Membrane protease YdiL (CAAX protease family) n=1 Tax=Rhizomicrobium palustre TaxID=189966 RepID=A0A846N219_9PROT|nr:CPBP family intramembrane glutamic endopeptidase [Rhizomicrobium palustre]NIK90024.1 membrane protease YdiL (CAAX protease family) [Rhizomicrobium palustre]
MRAKALIPAIIAILVLVAALELRDIFDFIGLKLPRIPMPYGRSTVDNLAAVLLVIVAALFLARKRRWALGKNLGLSTNGWRAPLVTLLATTPCWVGLALQGHLATDTTARDLLFTALLFPLAEEIVFRGFGFIFTRNQLGWNMTAAVLVQAVVFGAMHWLGAGGGMGMALQIFIMTALGGVIFALLDAMDGYTIWSGLVFHISLNAAWSVFTAPDAMVFGWHGNILRLVSAALALSLIYILHRKRA